MDSRRRLVFRLQRSASCPAHALARNATSRLPWTRIVDSEVSLIDFGLGLGCELENGKKEPQDPKSPLSSRTNEVANGRPIATFVELRPVSGARCNDKREAESHQLRLHLHDLHTTHINPLALTWESWNPWITGVAPTSNDSAQTVSGHCDNEDPAIRIVQVVEQQRIATRASPNSCQSLLPSCRGPVLHRQTTAHLQSRSADTEGHEAKYLRVYRHPSPPCPFLRL